ALPAEDDEVVPGRVSPPGRAAGREAPDAVVRLGPPQDRQQSFVKRAQRGVRLLGHAAPEMNRGVRLAALELSLVEEAQAGRQERDDGGGAVDVGREGGGGARLVVVFQEVEGAVAEGGRGLEVLAHGAGGA